MPIERVSLTPEITCKLAVLKVDANVRLSDLVDVVHFDIAQQDTRQLKAHTTARARVAVAC